MIKLWSSSNYNHVDGDPRPDLIGSTKSWSYKRLRNTFIVYFYISIYYRRMSKRQCQQLGYLFFFVFCLFYVMGIDSLIVIWVFDRVDKAQDRLGWMTGLGGLWIECCGGMISKIDNGNKKGRVGSKLQQNVIS